MNFTNEAGEDETDDLTYNRAGLTGRGAAAAQSTPSYTVEEVAQL
jgi:hypothetical protein